MCDDRSSSSNRNNCRSSARVFDDLSPSGGNGKGSGACRRGKNAQQILLSIVEQIKEKEQMTHSQLKALRCDFEARTYNYLALLNYLDDIEEGIVYYEKSLDIYLQFGIMDEAKAIQTSIDVMRTPSESSKAFMKNAKSVYEYNIEKNGLTSEHTMRFGLEYGELLLKMHHYNEAEKLATKLAADSRRVHGPDHNCTVRADMLLEKCKNRVSSSSSKSYHFLCCFLCPILFCYLYIGCLILFKSFICATSATC